MYVITHCVHPQARLLRLLRLSTRMESAELIHPMLPASDFTVQLPAALTAGHAAKDAAARAGGPRTAVRAACR